MIGYKVPRKPFQIEQRHRRKISQTRLWWLSEERGVVKVPTSVSFSHGKKERVAVKAQRNQLGGFLVEKKMLLIYP